MNKMMGGGSIWGWGHAKHIPQLSTIMTMNPGAHKRHKTLLAINKGNMREDMRLSVQT